MRDLAATLPSPRETFRLAEVNIDKSNSRSVSCGLGGGSEEKVPATQAWRSEFRFCSSLLSVAMIKYHS